MIPGHRHTQPIARRVDAADDGRRGWVRDVHHLEAAAVGVVNVVTGDVGVVAGHRHAGGPAKRVDAADDDGRGRVRDVHHLEAGVAVGYVGVGAGHCHAEVIARRRDAADQMSEVTVVDAILAPRVQGKNRKN